MNTRMLADIQTTVAQTRGETGRNQLGAGVMAAMASVPRHLFVPQAEQPSAYGNHPLPIGNGQTISQPYIVALMTDCLELQPEHSVLEIGTGSGYQTAILATLARQVYTLEIIESLALTAKSRLQQLGYTNIESKLGNGYFGWEEKGPFDGIIVTAAARKIPPPLLDQLKPGGRLVIPLGEIFDTQHLYVITTNENGKVHQEHVLPVRFVPLTGEN